MLNDRSYLKLLEDIQSASYCWVNMHFAATTNSYWNADDIPSAILHYWSLAVEEQFYFIWPLIFVLIPHIRNNRARAGHLIIFIGLSFCISYFWTFNDANKAFFYLASRAWQLILGGLLLEFEEDFAKVPRYIQDVLSSLSVIGIFVCSFIYNELTPIPGIAAVVPVVCTAFLLLTKPSFVNNLISNDFFRWFGARSYSLYLIHWPLQIYFTLYFLSSYKPQLSISLFSLFVTMILADICYNYVENCLKSWTFISKSVYLSLITGFCMYLFCFTLASVGANFKTRFDSNLKLVDDISSMNSDELISFTSSPIIVSNNTSNSSTLIPKVSLLPNSTTTELPTSTPISQAPNVEFNPDYMKSLEILLEKAIKNKEVPKNLNPDLMSAREDQGAVHCLEPNPDRTGCEFGNMNSSITIALLGDSHAYHWVRGINKIAFKLNFRVILIWRNTCPFVLILLLLC